MDYLFFDILPGHQKHHTPWGLQFGGRIAVNGADASAGPRQRRSCLRPDVVLLDLHMPDDHAFQPAFVKSEFQLSGARVLGMSLSSGEDDEESRALAESFGAVALLDRARFGNELIPTILRT